MSNVDHDNPLHPQDVRDDSVWDESPAPAFDNDEATDVLNDGHEDPLDVIEKSPGEQAVTKKSNAAFYAAVGAFALVAVGVVGFKAGLFRSFTGSDARPSAAVMPMASDPLPKPEANAASASLLPAVNTPVSADVFASTGDASTLGRGLEADAAALGVTGTPVGSSGAKVSEAVEQSATTAPVGTPVSSTASAEPSMPAVPAAPSPPPVASLAQAVPQADPVATAASVPAVTVPAGPTVAAAMPANASAGKAPRATRAVAATRKASNAKAPAVAIAPSEAAAPRVKQEPPTGRARASTKVAKRTPMRDDRADSKEILSGWKLRGTWPQRGPGQLAWIADAKGTLTTVAVGQRVGGAEVLLIGKRGEMVQTTAGQILP